MTIEVFTADTVGESLRIGVVQARFNEPVCAALRAACMEELTALGVHEEDVFVCTVPGALEIPTASLICAWIAPPSSCATSHW